MRANAGKGEGTRTQSSIGETKKKGPFGREKEKK